MSSPSSGTHPDHHVMNDLMTNNQNTPSATSALGKSSNGDTVQQSVSSSSSPPPSSEGSDSSASNTNLYITGIPRHYQLKELHDLFAPFGPIVNSRLLADRHSNGNGHRGVAFVRFASVDSCQNAIHQLTGKIFGDEPLMIKYANDNREQNNGRSFDQRGGLGGGMMAAAGWGNNPNAGGFGGLYDRPSFGGGGGGMENRSFRGGRGGRGPRGGGRGGGGGFQQQQMYGQRGMTMPQPYQYANYGPPAAAARMPSYPFNNSPSPSRNADGYALFVFHLPPTVTDADLQQLFQLHGTVTAATVMRDPATGSSKGYGFVSMLKYEDALRAIQMLNGFALGNKFLKVSFKKSSNKDGNRANRQLVMGGPQPTFGTMPSMTAGGYDRINGGGGNNEDLSAQFAAMQLQKQNVMTNMESLSSSPDHPRY